jgi:hypothetical protein
VITSTLTRWTVTGATNVAAKTHVKAVTNSAVKTAASPSRDSG